MHMHMHMCACTQVALERDALQLRFAERRAELEAEAVATEEQAATEAQE